MDFLKRNLKQYFISKQEKIYNEEVRSKNLSYDSWIESQEKMSGILDKFSVRKKKSLTNGQKWNENERRKSKSEGKLSEECEDCQWMEVIGRNSQFRGRKTYLVISASCLCRNIEYFIDKKADAILVKLYKGEVSQIAYGSICQAFAENENAILVYGDEDIKEGGTRRDPWFKPDWSPDRFLSGFYFGALVAIRAEALKETYVQCSEKGFLKGCKGK